MLLGRPGRFTTSAPPQTPAVCLERIAVGTCTSDTCRISSPNPGSILAQTCSVASGVTSRGAGPVPPVVTTRQQPSAASFWMALAIAWASSATTISRGVHGDASTSARYSRIAGPPSSGYSPRLTRSETVRIPIRAGIGTLQERVFQLPTSQSAQRSINPSDSRSVTTSSTQRSTVHSCVGSTSIGCTGGS